MRRLTRVSTLAAACLLAACAADQPLGPNAARLSEGPPSHSSAGGRQDVKVMTRNLYLGASLTPVTGGDPRQIPFTAAAVWGRVLASDIPARMDLIAAEIAAHRPDVVGLQEVSLWRTQSPGDAHLGNPVAASAVAYDFLQLVLDGLAARGEHYVVASTVDNVNAELPVFTGTGIMDVRLTDRDVILTRADVATRHAMSGNYLSRVIFARIGVQAPRGWNSVEVAHRGEWIRIVNTHLETEDHPLEQEGQARELIAMLAGESMPVIVLGDINSDAEDPEHSTESYGLLREAGFADAWSDANGDDPGYTSGLGELLRDPPTSPTKRIDVILHRDGTSRLKAQSASIFGNDPDARTAGGLWPSDHLGVLAAIRLQRWKVGQLD